ncbi:zinc-binding dehydrogenase [Rhodohalobacter sulfatireducens]|uniref:Zinc-binding dehydrogenase n=1 Tax=Rhodohalobacter sulfatireducens TaxID=2911366 RepID=A0ABS9KJL8_9BACT|nr:zinc-binding dehydrogenase [Rhodohalobacter sulfatireducens]MCG2591054.1 zinc-binding dehydrogenase [Rhodohalobacter sulfatireducens]
MRQLVTTANGDFEVLQVREVPDLQPANDELLVKVKASGLNFADILARKGQYPDGPDKPCVMGYEVSGVITEVGSDVDDAWVGKEVVAITRFGGQAEQVLAKENQVHEKPDRLSFEEAATLPVNYLTAWVLIVVMGGLRKNESVLIHNAGGGMGLAQLDIAKHIGARTFGTSSKRKHDFLNDRGLDHAIDYRNKDWSIELMNLTDDRGVELITDPLGGKHWKKSYKALRSTGRLGMFGISTASSGSSGGLKTTLNLLKTVIGMPIYHPLPLLDKNRGVFGVNLGHLWHEGEKAQQWMKEILAGVEEGWINPHVDTTFSFDEAGDAHQFIEERKNIGKVILVP